MSIFGSIVHAIFGKSASAAPAAPTPSAPASSSAAPPPSASVSPSGSTAPLAPAAPPPSTTASASSASEAPKPMTKAEVEAMIQKAVGRAKRRSGLEEIDRRSDESAQARQQPRGAQ